MDQSTSSRRVWLRTETSKSTASTMSGSSLRSSNYLPFAWFCRSRLLVMTISPHSKLARLTCKLKSKRISSCAFPLVYLTTHRQANLAYICKLRRSLYGLRKARREWAILLSNFILKWGFTRSAIVLSPEDSPAINSLQ